MINDNRVNMQGKPLLILATHNLRIASKGPKTCKHCMSPKLSK